jgi:hypothetical protein
MLERISSVESKTNILANTIAFEDIYPGMYAIASNDL